MRDETSFGLLSYLSSYSPRPDRAALTSNNGHRLPAFLVLSFLSPPSAAGHQRSSITMAIFDLSIYLYIPCSRQSPHHHPLILAAPPMSTRPDGDEKNERTKKVPSAATLLQVGLHAATGRPYGRRYGRRYEETLVIGRPLRVIGGGAPLATASAIANAWHLPSNLLQQPWQLASLTPRSLSLRPPRRGRQTMPDRMPGRYARPRAQRAAAVTVSPETPTEVEATNPKEHPMPMPTEQPYTFEGGPWHGQVHYQPRAVRPQHCMPNPAGGAIWAAADAWPGRERYAPAGNSGDAVLMTWRRATRDEIKAAEQERAERHAERHQDEDH